MLASGRRIVDFCRNALMLFILLIGSNLALRVETDSSLVKPRLMISQHPLQHSHFSVNDYLPPSTPTSLMSAELPSWCLNDQGEIQTSCTTSEQLTDYYFPRSGMTALQRGICSMDPVAAHAVVQHFERVIKLCEEEFYHEMWNCSLVRDFRAIPAKNDSNRNAGRYDDGVLPIGLKDTKESAFYYAVTRAAVAHAIADSCMKRHMMVCLQDETRMTINSSLTAAIRRTPVEKLKLPQISKSLTKGTIVTMARLQDWLWGNLSHVDKFAAQFSKEHLERGIAARNVRKLSLSDRINLHNSNVGLKIYEKSVVLLCKCHGLSASCATRTCWRRQADLRVVVKQIKNSYFAAKRVSKQQQKKRKSSQHLFSGSRRPRKISKRKLAYARKPPNLCHRSGRLGILGTRGRRCADVSEGACQRLCCGRGYGTKLVQRTSPCRCAFDWCCTVRCATCEGLELVRTCN